MLEVAQAFLEAAVGSPLGRREMLLQEFVAQFPEVHREVLTSALAGRLSLASLNDPVLRQALQTLCDAGALRSADGRTDVPPSMRGVVRGMLEPLSLRLWRAVRNARARAAHQSPLDVDVQATILEGELGLSDPDARAHLREFPLARLRDRARKSSAFERSPSAGSREAEMGAETDLVLPLTVPVPERRPSESSSVSAQGQSLPLIFGTGRQGNVLDLWLS